MPPVPPIPARYAQSSTTSGEKFPSLDVATTHGPEQTKSSSGHPDNFMELGEQSTVSSFSSFFYVRQCAASNGQSESRAGTLRIADGSTRAEQSRAEHLSERLHQRNLREAPCAAGIIHDERIAFRRARLAPRSIYDERPRAHVTSHANQGFKQERLIIAQLAGKYNTHLNTSEPNELTTF